MSAACPACGEPLEDGASFCEACGSQVGAAPTAADVRPEPTDEAPLTVDDLIVSTALGRGAARQHAPRPCVACGGTVGADGWCETCGAKQPKERDHFRETPAPWVAGVCDRGLVHEDNEDAMALSAEPAPGSRAVLVVLDGVSSSVDSDVASLAGARAARDALATGLPQGAGTPEARQAAVARTLADTVAAANAAIVDTTDPDSPHPASATFACAVVEGADLWVATIGDSRVYWVPDDGEPLLVSTDDSGAQLQIDAGVDRETAEHGPHAHTITKWLGVDAPDLVPRTAYVALDRPGWVLACSDGLWNYVSEPIALGDRVSSLVAGGATTPLDLALGLVAFANASGGHDNITATLARVGDTDPTTA